MSDAAVAEFTDATKELGDKIVELSLKEAKELVDNAPGTTIKEQVSKEEAEQVKAKLEEQGAAVGLK